MKRLAILVIVIGLGVASLIYVQRRKERSAVSANAVLSMMADTQRDVMRAPMELTRISDDEETRIGDEMARRYEYSWRVSSGETVLDQTVQRIGGRLAAQAHRKLNYRFHLIVDDNFVNAFALPGGHIFVGSGLIRLMDTEDELASVLGHELEHIDHYHCAEKVQIEAQSRRLQLGVIAELAQIPLMVFEAGYSKDQEAEADREGLLLASASGFSPFGAVSMFEKFAKLQADNAIHAETPPEELSQVALETLTGYFRSHPLPQERIAQAKRVIADHHLGDHTKQTPLENA